MDTRSFDTPDHLELEIRLGSGSIEITAEARATTMLEISGERDPEEFRIEFSSRPDDRHRLVVAQKKHRVSIFGWNREARIRVRVPEGTDLEVASGSADLSARGELGSLSFHTASGDLQFDDVHRDVVAKTASGDARGGAVKGNLVFNAASGDLRVERVEGEMVIRTASGDVEVGAIGPSMQATTASGDVNVGSVATGDVKTRTVSGDVQIGVRPGTSVWLDLTSVSGEAVCERRIVNLEHVLCVLLA